MQAVMENTQIKQKKRHPILVFFIVLLILLCALAAGAYWYYFIRVHPQYRDLSGYSDMPADAAGNNMIGNIPENLQNGGFMAGQNGWIYYANFADNGSLYVCNESGGASLKLTDFPVANINVLEGTLIFTRLEKCYIAGPDGVNEIELTDANDAADRTAHDESLVYGGKLYAIYGLHTGGELRFSVIDEGNTYYAPYLDKDGLFTFGESDGRSVLYNKTRDTSIPIGAAGERIIKQFIHGGVIYLELQNGSDSRIMRVDERMLWPVDYIKGRNLCKSGTGFVFHGGDGFIYEISPDGYDINPISTVPVNEFRMVPNGNILAYTSTGGRILLSKMLYDTGVTGRFINLIQRVVQQNGWYNYFNARLQLSDAFVHHKLYKVNGNGYYHIRSWARFGDYGADWLNIQSESAVADTEKFRPQTKLTPTWGNPEDNGSPGLPDSTKDFGSEADDQRLVEKSVSTTSAADDPHDALDAAILLLKKDDSVYSKYSAESIAALQKYYGSSFDMAVSSASDGFARDLETRLGTPQDASEIADIIMMWFDVADYSVKGAEINNGDAKTTVTTSSAVDLSLLDGAAEAELTKRVAEKPTVLLMKEEDRTAWILEMLTEIVKAPKQYGIINEQPTDTVIAMQNVPDTGWVVEDIGLLIDCLIRGMD